MAHEPGRQLFDSINEPDPPPTGEHPFDSDAWKKHLNRLIEWRSEARTAHNLNRLEQSIDADFVDGDQWSEQDAKALRDRGQAPLKFNKTATFTRWITGTERRTRIESKVLPREDDDVQAAQIKTKLLKFTADINKSARHRSKAFQDAIQVGVGWLEDGARSDPEDEPIFSRSESWRNMWWDALSREDDLSDARYLFREKWVDLDVAVSMFPERRRALELAAETHELFAEEEHDEHFRTALYWRDDETGKARATAQLVDVSFHIGQRRRRVRLIECWYRVPMRTEILRTFADRQTPPEVIGLIQKQNGQNFDAANPLHERLITQGFAATFDAIKLQVRVAIFTMRHLLQDMKSPYKHNRFPFTPIWAYRRDRDGMPYGVVRNMRDPQDDLNKRRSKALFILSTRGMIADIDAFDDWDEVEEELARPDYILKKKRGRDVEINTDNTLAEQHLKLMDQDERFLESSSGVTEENLGESTNAISGRAILARTNQGTLVTASLFDNLRWATQHQGEIRLSLIEQFMSEPKVVRVTNDEGAFSFLRVNFPTRNDDGSVTVENDIQGRQADFVVDAQDFRETVRLAMFEQMMAMIERLDPEVSLKLLDLVFDLSDLPTKDVWVKRIRAINGQIDPDDPNVDAKEAERQAAEAAQAALEERGLTAEAKQKEALAEQKIADSARKRSDVMEKAVGIAAQLQAFPELAAAVDTLFKNFNEDPDADTDAVIPELPRPSAEAPLEPAAALPQPGLLPGA
ncbi:MAG: hypothetical protein V3V08_13165 [Nannocystaceae bacterium]